MGWLGVACVAGGVILVWSGVQGVDALDVIRAVLRGEPVPRADVISQPTPGTSNAQSGFDGETTPGAGDGAGAGKGLGGGGGGGW